MNDARPIPGFPGYTVSSDGAVFGKRGTLLRSHLSGAGRYPSLGLWRDGRHHTKRVHNLVASAWLPPRPSDDHEVAHNNGDAINCAASNLRWATHRENCADTVAHGRSTRGCRHPNRKLNDEAVRLIRADWNRGKTARAIASDFGISTMAAWRAATGQRWGHVT